MAIAKAGGIPPLIKLLGSAVAGVQDQASTALHSLILENRETIATIASAGGIPPLIALLPSPLVRVQIHVVYALCFLSTNAQNRVSIVATGGYSASHRAAIVAVKPCAGQRYGHTEKFEW